MYLLYSILLCLYFAAALPVVMYQRFRYGKPWGRLGDRLGWVPVSAASEPASSIWVHAVSVGEVMTVRALLGDLRETYPSHRLLVSTTTATGQQVASQLGQTVDAVFYAPLDLPRCVNRALTRTDPALLILVDTELWPHWLRACRRRGVRTMVVNGRISDRSYRGYRRGKRFMSRVLADVDRVCAQTPDWGQRFVDLGLPRERLSISGSLKSDMSRGVADTRARVRADRALRDFSFIQDRAVLMAASTLKGEDEPVLRAFARIRADDPTAVLVLAPRHPERAPSVIETARRFGFQTVARTALPPGMSMSPDVVVLDTVGELAGLFELSTLVFVGGSLVPAGGHNILEPAVFRKPIVFGPHMQNFADITTLFLRESAAIQVQSPAELEQVLVELRADPARCASLGEAARAVVDANRGARRKTLDVARELLPTEVRLPVPEMASGRRAD